MPQGKLDLSQLSDEDLRIYEDLLKAKTAKTPTTGGVTDNRTASEVRRDQANNVIEGVGQFFTGLPKMAADTGSAVMDAFNPLSMQSKVNSGMAMIQGAKDAISPLLSDTANLAKSVLNYRSNKPQSTPEQQRGYANLAGQTAAPILAGIAINRGPELIKAVNDVIPTKQGGGAKFAEINSKIGSTPVDLSSADDAALDAMKLSGGQLGGRVIGTGSTAPKVLRDYIAQRGASPQMDFETARQFQSKAGSLSAEEVQAINKTPMQGKIAALAKALADSNRTAATAGGMGDVYDEAMTEYRRAMQINATRNAVVDALKKHGIKAAVGTGIAYEALKGASK